MSDNFFVNLPPVSAGGSFLPLTGGTMLGSINMNGFDIFGGGRVAQGITVHTLTNGETYTVANNWAYVLFYAGGGVVATQTTHMPPNPIVGQTVTFTGLAGGITAWTLNTTEGSVLEPSAPTSLASGESYTFAFVLIGPSRYWVQVNHTPAGEPWLPLSGGTLTGNLLFSADAAHDIGSPDGGTTLERPNFLYLANTLKIGSGSSDTQAAIVLGDNLNYQTNYVFSITLSQTGAPTALISGVGPNGNLDTISFDVPVVCDPGFETAGGVVANGYSGQLGSTIVTGAGDTSAILSADSTTQGFLPPRMTTVQKTAISTPATGLVVYDSTLNKLSVFTGSAWETVTSA